MEKQIITLKKYHKGIFKTIYSQKRFIYRYCINPAFANNF